MIGLIKKDLFVVKANLKNLIIVVLAFVLMSFQGEGGFIFMLPFLALMIIMANFSYDDYNKWDAYCIATPGGRKTTVKARYLATLILATISTIISAILIYISSKITSDIDLIKSLEELYGSVIALFLVMDIMYPITYKFGIQKSRIVLFTIVFALVSISMLFINIFHVKFSMSKSLVDFMNDYFNLIMLFLTICTTYESYKISEKVYLKKEF